jgi:hypothetical protein
MRWINLVLSYLLATPSGLYTGSKSLFGETINAVVNLKSADALDFAISGDFTLDCKDEPYTVSGNEVVLSNIGIIGDCAHDALTDNGITLKSITYDNSNDKITVSVKYSIANVDVVLSKANTDSLYIRYLLTY